MTTRQFLHFPERLVQLLALLLLLRPLILNLVFVLRDVEFEVHQLRHAFFPCPAAAAATALLARHLIFFVEGIGAEEVVERPAFGRQRFLQAVGLQIHHGFGHLVGGLAEIFDHLLLRLVALQFHRKRRRVDALFDVGFQIFLRLRQRPGRLFEFALRHLVAPAQKLPRGGDDLLPAQHQTA